MVYKIYVELKKISHISDILFRILISYIGYKISYILILISNIVY